MEPYAVIETGGKQYMVHAGQTIEVELLKGNIGDKVTLDRVLAFCNGTQTTIGAPAVSNAKVTAEIVTHKKGRKVVSFRKKRRKGYSRKKGHRQNLTVLKICEISPN